MSRKAADIIKEVIELVEDRLPAENVSDAREFLDHSEWGEALDLIVTQLYEFDLAVSQSVFSLIDSAGSKMGMDSKDWEILEVVD
jgi:hypothetical protein